MQTEKRVIALGFFDGVHLGHGALLRRVGEKAAELGAVPAAVTFDTHPENLILKTPAVPLLSSPLDRAELMRRFYGIREVIVAHFDERMMHMPWREFVTDYLAGEHGAVHLVAAMISTSATRGRATRSGSRPSAGSWASAATLSPRWYRTISPSPPPISVPWWPRGRWSGPTSSWATPTP